MLLRTFGVREPYLWQMAYFLFILLDFGNQGIGQVIWLADVIILGIHFYIFTSLTVTNIYIY